MSLSNVREVDDGTPPPTQPHCEPWRTTGDDRCDATLCAHLDRQALDPDLGVNYLFGLVLGVDELNQEDLYLRERDDRLAHVGHGVGTATGLHVTTARPCDRAVRRRGARQPGSAPTSSVERSSCATRSAPKSARGSPPPSRRLRRTSRRHHSMSTGVRRATSPWPSWPATPSAPTASFRCRATLRLRRRRHHAVARPRLVGTSSCAGSPRRWRSGTCARPRRSAAPGRAARRLDAHQRRGRLGRARQGARRRCTAGHRRLARRYRAPRGDAGPRSTAS